MLTGGDWVEEGHIPFMLKWQLIAAERRTFQKSDSNDVIGFRKLCKIWLVN